MPPSDPPSKHQILEQYRHLIAEEDFEVLASEPPSPAELQREGAWLQYLGSWDGFCLLVKKNIKGIALAVYVFVSGYGDFAGGIQAIS